MNSTPRTWMYVLLLAVSSTAWHILWISVITGREGIQPRMIERLHYWFPLHLKYAINLKYLFNCKVCCISIFQKAPAQARSKIMHKHKWFPFQNIISNIFWGNSEVYLNHFTFVAVFFLKIHVQGLYFPPRLMNSDTISEYISMDLQGQFLTLKIHKEVYKFFQRMYF